jgi:urease accessory protein
MPTRPAERRPESLSRALRLLQFGDSMFPVGGFSFSLGVETAVAQAVVHDEDSLTRWVRAVTRNAAAGDGIAVLHAHRAAEGGDLREAVRADEAVLARKLNEETRTMTVRTGQKLAEAAARVVPDTVTGQWREMVAAGQTPGTYPAGLGVLCARLGLGESDAFAIHQYTAAVTMVSAAVRLMPLHHLAAQEVLFKVNGHTSTDFAAAAGRTLADMSGFAPQIDVLACVHVRAHVRMFMN